MPPDNRFRDAPVGPAIHGDASVTWPAGWDQARKEQWVEGRREHLQKTLRQDPNTDGILVAMAHDLSPIEPPPKFAPPEEG